MNSRDAAFDESLKEIIEATAAEAAAAHDTMSVTSNGHINGMVEEDDIDQVLSGRRKRKRTEDDALVCFIIGFSNAQPNHKHQFFQNAEETN